jgi:tetratricopeptide (TPR) repeat protein
MAKLAAERLDRGAEAIRLLKEVLDLDAQADGVLDQLERQAERQKDYETVAHVLERRVGESDDDKTKLTILQKLGVLCADKLDDTEGANQAWRRVLEISPGHKRALRVLRQSYVDSADWEGLEDLYRSQEDAEGLADFLSTTADRVEDADQKVVLSFRAARVYAEELQAPERAVRSYERVLSVDDGNEEAARALLPLYEQEEKWSRLPGLYMVLLEATDDVDAKIEILHRVADVTGGPLANKSAALAHARQAYDLRPDEEGLERLEAWSRQSGEWTAFIEVLKARLEEEGEGDPAVARELQLKLAGIYAEEVERVEEAVEIYRSLVESDESDEESMLQLEELLRAADRRDDLRWLFGLKCERLDGAERCEALEEWAAAEENVFGEPDKAIELLEAVQELDASRTSALAALTRLLLSAERYEQAAKTMRAHRDAAEADEQVDIELSLAELELGKLERSEAALEACIRVLELDPGNLRAVEILEQLVDLEDTRAAAARALETIYGATGAAEKQVVALRVMLETEQDDDERLGLCQRLADVYERDLANAASAFEVVLNALLDFPGDVTLWDRASELAVAAGNPTDLAEAYRKHLARPAAAVAEEEEGEEGEEGEPADGEEPIAADLQIELCERAAVLHEDHLGDAEGAVPYLERMLALDPGNGRAFERLKQILNAVERWTDLEELYRRAIGSTDEPEAKVELLREVALVAEDMVGDDVKATSYYEQILELDEGHDGAYRALERLYSRQERHEQLAELLENRLILADEDDAVGVRLQLAELYLHELEAHDHVMEHLEAILTDRPSEADARKLAEECLQVDSLRQPAAKLLDGVYESRDEVRDLVRVLEVRLEAAEDDDDRRALLGRIGTLRDERLKDDAGAFAALSELLPLEPDDVDLRERYVEIGQRLGEQERMAKALLETAGNCSMPGTQGEILMAAAGIFRDLPDHLDQAEKVYRQVLEIDADDPGLVLPAARALAVIYEAQGEHAKLADALSTEVRLVQEPDERAALFGRIANLYEDILEDPKSAIDAWQARLEDDGADVTALTSLERLYRRTEAWQELVDVLRHLEQAAAEGDERRRCMVSAAEVLAEHLEQTGEAINAWRSVLDDFGPELDTLSALSDLYEKAERWEDLAEVVEVWLSLVDEFDERVELFTRLGDVRRLHLDDEIGALSAYRDVLTLDASHEGARDALAKMLEHDNPDVKRDAAETLRPLYEADGDADKLLRVLDIEIDATFEPDAKLDRIRMALSTAEDNVTDSGRAFAYACRGVREAIGEPAVADWLETAERLAGETSRWSDLMDLFEGVVDEMLDADVQQQTRLRAGELARTVLEDDERAIRHYRKALEERADDRRAMVALEELYEATDDAPQLLEILRLRAETAESEEERVELLFRIAKLQAGPIGETDAAIETYEDLLTVSFERDAVEALEALYRKAERHDALVDLYDRQLSSDDEIDVAAIRVKIAKVAYDHLEDGGRALEEIGEALSVDPVHAEAIETLERMLEQSKDPDTRAQVAQMLEPVYLRAADWAKLRLVLEARLESCVDPMERGELLRQLATLYEEQLEDYSAALETMAKLLREDPANDEIWSELERISRVLGADERLADIYAGALDEISADDPKTAELCQRTGELYQSVDQTEKSLKWYRRAYEFSPESEEIFEAIDDLLVALEQAEERVDHYRGALDQTFDDDRRVMLLHVIASLQQSSLDKPEDAIETLRDVLQLDERNDEAFDALTDLYKKADRRADLAELYLSRAELSEDAERSAVYRLALAQLLAQEEGNVERAIDQLEVIVTELPWHEEATEELEKLLEGEEAKMRVLDLLRPLYERAGNWEGLVRLNRERLELLEEPVDRVEVLTETATLWEVNGEDLEKAFTVLCNAFLLMPEEERTQEELKRLAEELDAWARLAKCYEEAIETASDEFVKRHLLGTLADVYDERLADPRRAIGALARLNEIDPDEIEPLDRMMMLCMLLGDWAQLVGVLSKKADLIVDDAESADILRRIGSIKGEMLEDADGAVAAYQRALELEPESTETLDKLIELFESRDDARQYVDYIEQRIEIATDDEDELRYQLTLTGASCFEERLESRADAVRLLERARDWRPTDAAVLAGLERLYGAEKMFDELLENLKVQATIAESTEQRNELRNKIGDLYVAEFDNAFDALEQYRTVLDEAANDEHAIAKARGLGKDYEDLRLDVAALLEPVLTNAGRFEELVEIIEMRFSAQSDPVDRARSLCGMALIQEEQLDEHEAARDTLLRAVKQTPDDATLHDDVARLCELTDDWGRYADVLAEQAADQMDSEVATDLFSRLGRAAEEHLDDPERAIKAYQEAVDRAGQQPELLEALDRLYVRTDNADKLAEILTIRVDVEESEQNQAELLYRLAVLQVESFEDKPTALSTLREVVERSPEHAGAREQLEALTDDSDLFEEVAELLEELYQKSGDNQALARLFEKRIGFAPTAADRVQMRLKLARMLEDRAFDTEAAQAAIERAFADDVTESELLAELERLAAANAEGGVGADAWRSAADALSKAVADGLTAEEEGRGDGSLTPEVARDLFLRTAKWYKDDVGDSDGADRVLQLAYEQDPRNADTLLQLEDLHRGPGRETDLVQTLRRLAELAQSPGSELDRSAAELRREAKELAEGALEDEKLAEEILRESLQAADTDLWVLSELSRLREKAEDWEEVYGLLNRRIELTEEAADRRELRHQAAAIAADELDQQEAAIDLYEQAFQDEPSDEVASQALRKLYAAAEQFDDMLRLIEKLTELAEEPEQRAELQLESAKLCIEHLDAPTEGIEHLNAVLDAAPGHTEAVDLLSEMLEKEGRDDELASLLTRQILHAHEVGDQSGELAFRVRLAELQETRLNEPDKAIEEFLAVLEADASFRPALEALARLYEQEDQPAKAAAMVERLLEGADDEESVRLALKACDLYGNVDDAEAACRVLEGVLEQQPTVAELSDRLRGLYRKRGAWEELAVLITTEAERTEDDAEKVVLFRQAAEIHAEERADHGAAAELLERALELQPEDRDLMLALCDEFTASGRSKEAIEVLERVVESYGGRRSKDLGDIHMRIAAAHLADGDEEAALIDLESARKMDPGSIKVLHQLGQLSLRLGEKSEGEVRDAHTKRAANSFRSLLLQKLDDKSPVTKAQVFYYLAQVNLLEDDKKKAIQMLERALANDKVLEEAKVMLDELKG